MRGRWALWASDLALKPQTDELLATDLALVLDALGRARGRAAGVALGAYARA
jgi:hypothetical protein